VRWDPTLGGTNSCQVLGDFAVHRRSHPNIVGVLLFTSGSYPRLAGPLLLASG